MIGRSRPAGGLGHAEAPSRARCRVAVGTRRVARDVLASEYILSAVISKLSGHIKLRHFESWIL